MSRYIIDKSKLIENINIIKNKAGVEVIGVVKGNGYGFGMCSLAEILMQNEINTFAVTEVYDVPLLRETVIDRDILVMRSTSIDFCGAYTHFSSAFHNAELTKVQLEMFKDTIEQIKKAGKNVGILHAANSPALLNVDGVTLDAVRIGSAFTGRVITRGKNPLNKLGELQAEVIETKTVPKGYSIGYNGQYKTKRETKIAIVPIGHFDGFGLQKGKETADFHSVLSQLKHYLQKEQLTVNVNGKKYNVIGEIGLSHTAIDITDSDVKIGDIASVEISPLMVNPNVPRIYK